MDFYQASYDRKQSKLREWRGKYSKKEYPFKVVKNLFYDLFADKHFWLKAENIILQYQHTNFFGNFRESYEYLLKERRKIQLNEIHADLLSLMKDEELVLDYFGSNISFFQTYKEMVEKAENKSNKAVENIEYSYIFFEIVSDLLLRWQAVLATGVDFQHPEAGLDRHKAFISVTGVSHGELDLDNFSSAFKSFCKPVAITLQREVQKENGGVVEDGLYNKLPDLWT